MTCDAFGCRLVVRFDVGEHARDPSMAAAPLGRALCTVDARAHEVVREFDVCAARVAHEFTIQQLVQPGIRFRFAPAATFGDRLRCERSTEGGADCGDRTRTRREPREAPADEFCYDGRHAACGERRKLARTPAAFQRIVHELTCDERVALASRRHVRR